MSPERTDKVRRAREAARAALGRPLGGTSAYHGLRAARPARIRAEGVTWAIPAESEAVLTLADTARVLRIPRSEVDRMVAAGELRTVPIGLRGTMVPRDLVDRVRAQRFSADRDG